MGTKIYKKQDLERAVKIFKYKYPKIFEFISIHEKNYQTFYSDLNISGTHMRFSMTQEAVEKFHLLDEIEELRLDRFKRRLVKVDEDEYVRIHLFGFELNRKDRECGLVYLLDVFSDLLKYFHIR